jgi:hypothetical protein
MRRARFHDRRLICFVSFMLTAWLLPAASWGGTILWSVEDWPDPNPGPVLDHSLTVDDDEVRWQFSGDTDNFHDTSPNDANRLRGGTGGQSLLMRWRPDAIGDQISLAVSFDHPDGVEAVQLQLFDIDRAQTSLANSQWGDRVTVMATTTSGAVINPTFSNLGSSVAIDGAGSLVGVSRANNNGGDGNALIEFAQPIRSMTIVFEDMGVGDFREDRDHEIGVSSVSFSVVAPVPEPSGAFLVLTAVFGLMMGRRRQS